MAAVFPLLMPSHFEILTGVNCWNFDVLLKSDFYRFAQIYEASVEHYKTEREASKMDFVLSASRTYSFTEADPC